MNALSPIAVMLESSGITSVLRFCVYPNALLAIKVIVLDNTTDMRFVFL